mmetsp:Transcript_31777/g.79709  ORF Transcript_31777/g.79709 Transcript_31777/m.79709 type:complete len:260 (-) Transcript_31777:1721-2500(-)
MLPRARIHREQPRRAPRCHHAVQHFRQQEVPQARPFLERPVRDGRPERLHRVFVARAHPIAHALGSLLWSHDKKNVADPSRHCVGQVRHSALVEDDHGNVVTDDARALQFELVARVVGQPRGHMEHDLHATPFGKERRLAVAVVRRVQPACIVAPPLQPHLLSQDAEELFKQAAAVLVVPHVPLRRLPPFGKHNANREARCEERVLGVKGHQVVDQQLGLVELQRQGALLQKPRVAAGKVEHRRLVLGRDLASEVAGRP